ncbi:MAG: hypothetical protein ABI806_05965 [Candidatus Solibacter sp.]
MTRLHYSKVVADCLRYVIVDRSPDGGLHFSSQEPGDVRWYPFDPSPEERAAALDLWRSSADNAPGWPLLLP